MEISLAGAHQKYPTIALHPSCAIKVVLAGVTHLKKTAWTGIRKVVRLSLSKTNDGPVQL